jgi:hypothetical protein
MRVRVKARAAMVKAGATSFARPCDKKDSNKPKTKGGTRDLSKGKAGSPTLRKKTPAVGTSTQNQPETPALFHSKITGTTETPGEQKLTPILPFDPHNRYPSGTY